MILRGWSIEGYGVFAGAASPELSRGVNVILGPNEAGKSTLLSFIRHTLFGYPAKNSRTDTFVPALRGGPLGGRLFLEDATGAKWTVERFHGKKGVNLTGPAGERLGEEELAEMLGNLDGGAYRSVFGFDLADLASLEAMSNDKIKGRLMSAGISGAGDTAEKALRFLEDRQAALLKERGAARLNALAERLKTLQRERDEAAAQLCGYAELVARQAVDEAEASRLISEIEKHRARADLLKAFVKWKPTLVRLQGLRRELEGLASLPAFPEDGLERFRSIAQTIADLEGRIREIGASIDGETAKAAALAADPSWVAAAPPLAALDRAGGEHKGRLAELAAAKLELESAEHALGLALEALGQGWDTRRLAKFLPDVARSGEAKRYNRLATEAEARLKVARASHADAAGRLKALAGEATPVAAAKPDYASGSAMLGFAAAAVLLSLLFAKESAPYGYAFAGALGAAGVYFLVRGKAPATAQPASGELALAKIEAARAQAQLLSAESEKTALLAEWAVLCGSWGIGDDRAPSPETTEELLDRIEKARAEAALVERLGARVAGIEELVREFESHALTALAETPYRDRSSTGEGMLRLISEAAEIASRESKKESEAENLRARIKSLERDGKLLEEKTAAAAEEASALLNSCGASDEDDLRRIAGAYANRQRLEGEIKSAGDTLASQFGPGFAESAGGEEFESSGVEAWSSELASLQHASSELSERLSALNRAIGANAARIAELERSTEVVRLDSSIEAVKTEAGAAAREWLVASMATGLVRGALDKFARERQPGVLAEASRLFALMTEGRYARILQPPGETGLRAERADGAMCDVAALSRGTREELYLAIRLGLASDFAGRGADLPILADDVFVNFDPARAEAAIGALCAFADNRQAVVFTCHPETAARFKKVAPATKTFSLQRESGTLQNLEH